MIDKIIEQQETIKGMQENEESAIKIMKMYEDYKLRVDKAIEYMKNYIKVEPLNEPVKVEFKEVINILKGDEK